MRVSRWLLGIVLCLLMVSSNPTSVAAAISPDLEQAILEVIDQHPEAILRSLSNYQQQRQQQQAQAAAQALDQVRQDLPGFIGQSPLRGDRTAKVMLVEVADFQCPYCIQAYQPIQALLSQHPEVGFVFKHLPLSEIHNQALPAAKAAWAAGQQGKFWEFHDGLFSQSSPLTDDRYTQIAQGLHLNLTRFERDRTSVAATQAIDTDLAQAKALGIDGTPVFLVLRPSGAHRVSGANIPAIEAYISN